jgi:hypothetical protein
VKAVTVDTGGPDDVFVGACVVWMHTPRGGYGYSMPVDAKVLGHSLRPHTQVTIEVKTKKGAALVRHVKAENLRWRER